ncbi:MAG: C39 family peptidase [Candidatus Eisenbacteria bacterium]|nr:C39 family peptidase [Candidatus Eisenbacteria bacterium]
MDVATRTISEIASYEGAGSLGLPDLRGAAPGQPLAVHHPRSGEVAYRLVPVFSGGRAIALIGVNASGDRRLWISFGSEQERFPPVTPGRAAERAAEHARSLGAPEPSAEGRLVEGADKRLYWAFDAPGDDFWLVDAGRPGADVLGSVDGSHRAALATPVDLRRGRAAETLAPLPDKAGTDTDRAIPDAYVIPGVPYHYQITSWFCGPAALQMVMDYYGEEIGQHPISDVANDVTGSGCYSDDMLRAAHFSGMSTAIQDTTLRGYAERKLGYACPDFNLGIYPNPRSQTKHRICSHEPLFALTWYGPTHTSGHYRVIRGYDDNLDVFLIHDPWYGAPYSGPDVLFDQTFFVEDLWAYTNQWAMTPAPWLLNPSISSGIAAGDTFLVELEVVYPGSGVFTGKNPCTGCLAEIHLPSGFSLVSGSAAQSLSDLSSGNADTVSWEVAAGPTPGAFDIRFGARGTVSASCWSYGSYQDSIGGHGLETVQVDPARLDGWEDEVRLTSDPAASGTGFPGGRALAVEDDGTVHVVWSDSRNGNGEIYYRVLSGGTWQTETRLTADTAFSDGPAIALDETGGVHVAWVDTRDGEREIYYKTNDGSGWSADERVTSFSGADFAPTIAAGGDGVYLAWQRNVSGLSYYAVLFSARTDTGWSDPMQPDDSSIKNSYRPSLAWGTDGLLHLVYEREGTTAEWEKIRHRSWDGDTWSSADVLASGLAPSRNPVIAAGPAGTLHVVWQDYEHGGGDIFYAEYDGSSWAAAESLASATAEAGTPSVAAGGDGRVHVAWVDHRHSRSEIYARTREGGIWSGDMRLSGGPDHSMLPSIAANGCGFLCAAWTDYRHGNTEIYFRCESVETGVALVENAAGARPLPTILSAPRPAPFTVETRLSFSLDRPGRVVLGVYDIAGRRVRSLADAVYPAGVHETAWDGRSDAGRDAAPGVYFVRCRTPRGAQARRVVRLR